MKRLHLLCIGVVVCALLIIFAWWYSQEKVQPPQLQAEASALRELKEKWKGVIEQEGGERAYARFLKEAPETGLETHGQAHAFGEALYEVEGIDGLKACDSSFEFGCYHSFFGVAVYNEGIETLPKFDAACSDKFGNMNMPCQHGIGHGVLVYTDYNNLVDALELCETINTLPTGGCSSGVFMEYNFHTMDETRGTNFFRSPSKDLHEPCNALPSRFRASCYFEQVQWWQNVFHSNFSKIGALCEELPQGSAEFVACYNGAGNYAAAEAHLDVTETVRLCSFMPSDATRALCHEGASWLVGFDVNKQRDAQQICEVLDEPYRNQCLQKLDFSS